MFCVNIYASATTTNYRRLRVKQLKDSSTLIDVLINIKIWISELHLSINKVLKLVPRSKHEVKFVHLYILRGTYEI